MATVDLVKMDASKAGNVELDSRVFEAAVKPHLFHAEVQRQLAKRRGGTHATKNRSRVSGGGAKQSSPDALPTSKPSYMWTGIAPCVT